MIINYKKLVLLIGLIMAGHLPVFSQTATLQITTSGFQNEDSVVTNGMTWGIVVDTNSSGGSGFSDLQSNLTASVVPIAGNNSQLNIGGIASDLYLFIDATFPTTTNSGPPSFNDGFINQITINGTGLVESGDPYFLMWLPDSTINNGDPVGLFNPGLTMPADGAGVTISSSITAGSADFTVVPEPSSALLLLIGSACLFFKRRYRS